MPDLFGNKSMLALSWKQPFGSAMLLGKVETRVWNTSYRGLVLICTSKTPYDEKTARSICGEDLFENLCNLLKRDTSTLDLNGYAIGVATLECSWTMEAGEDELKSFVKFRQPWKQMVTLKDKSTKTVTKRLYCHRYSNVRPIKPFEWNGCQGWKKVDQETINRLEFI